MKIMMKSVRTIIALAWFFTSAEAFQVPSVIASNSKPLQLPRTVSATSTQLNSLAVGMGGSATIAKALDASGKGMAELFVAGCIGTACVKKDYLNTNMIQSLSKTNFSILLPMFYCTAIMKTVQTYGLSKSSVAVPLIAIVQSVLLFFVSKFMLLPIFGIDKDAVEGRATAVCCTFGNSGVIPLIFSEALFRSQPDLLLNAYAQVSLYLAGWSPLFWSFGKNALIGDDTVAKSENKQGGIKDVMENLKSLVPPPVVGTFMGGIIASIAFLRTIFMTSQHKRAPLEVVYNCVDNFGRAANPLALLILTASLALGSSQVEGSQMTKKLVGDPEESVNEPGAKSIGLVQRLSCVSAARFLCSPALMWFILTGASRTGIIGSIAADPMVYFILMLQGEQKLQLLVVMIFLFHNFMSPLLLFSFILASMPSAQNAVLMLQVAEKTKEASRLARFLFSMYAIAMVPVVVITSVLLGKCGLIQ